MFVTGKYALRVFCSELLFLVEGWEVVREGLLSVRFSLTVVMHSATSKCLSLHYSQRI